MDIVGCHFSRTFDGLGRSYRKLMYLWQARSAVGAEARVVGFAGAALPAEHRDVYLTCIRPGTTILSSEADRPVAVRKNVQEVRSGRYGDESLALIRADLVKDELPVPGSRAVAVHANDEV